MLSNVQVQSNFNNPMLMGLNKNSIFETKHWSNNSTKRPINLRTPMKMGKGRILCVGLSSSLSFPHVDSLVIASELSALSLFPYMGFLYFITKSKSAPRLTLFGFYFLLVFVAATIPAGLYAKTHYMTFLSNVDWLHGGAESLLTLTNLFIVLGLRDALRKTKDDKENTLSLASEVKEEEKSSISV